MARLEDAVPSSAALRTWALQTAAAGSVGAIYGATIAFLRTQPIAYIAGSCALNYAVFGGAVMGSRAALLHWDPFPAAWSAAHASSAVSAGLCGGLVTAAVSGRKKGVMGVALWGGLGFVAQEAHDQWRSRRGDAAARVRERSQLMAQLTPEERTQFATFSSRLLSAHKMFGGNEGSAAVPLEDHLRLFVTEQLQASRQQQVGQQRAAAGAGADDPELGVPLSTRRGSGSGRGDPAGRAPARDSLHPLEGGGGGNARITAAEPPAAEPEPTAAAAAARGAWDWLPIQRLGSGEATERQLARLKERLREIDEALNDGTGGGAAGVGRMEPPR